MQLTQHCEEIILQLKNQCMLANAKKKKSELIKLMN